MFLDSQRGQTPLTFSVDADIKKTILYKTCKTISKEEKREKDGFININNKTKQANGPKQSLFGLTTPIHIQIKQYEKEEKIKRKEKEKKKERKKKKKKSITLHFNRNGFTLQKRQNKKKLKPLYQYRQNQNQHLGST